MNRETLLSLFLEQADRFPDRHAVVHNGQSITYTELKTKAQRLGMFLLREFALEPEQLVGIHGGRSIDSVLSMLAVLLAGGAYVPLPADWPQYRKKEVIDDAGLRIVLSECPLQGLKNVSFISIKQTLEKDTGTQVVLPDITPGQLAYVMYTSGSTGKPKGVMIEQRNVLAMLRGFEAVAPSSISLAGACLVSIGFDVSVWEIFSVLCFGGTLHLIDYPEMVPDLVRYFNEYRINSAYLPPMILDDFIDATQKKKNQPSLKRLLVGVEPIVQRTLGRFIDVVPDLRIINGYGPTETTICATFFPFEKAEDPERRTPIGKALQDYQVHLVDEKLREVEPGCEGEVLICGAGVGRGYYNDEELTAQKFIIDPFSKRGNRCFRSGDFARRLPDGNIEFIGRRDQQFKISGFRIELGEIETALNGFSGVRQAAAIVRKDGQGEKRIVAYYTVVKNEAVCKRELKSYLRELLPAYMQPYALTHLEHFPLTPNGKIDRKKLPDVPDKPQEELAAPETKMELILAGIFQRVFSYDNFGMEDSFFDLGGNSLQAARIIMLIRDELCFSLSIPQFYEHPTIRKLAELLSTGEVLTGEKVRLQIPRCEGSKEFPLSYSQERMWFLAQSEPDNPSSHSSFALRLSGDLDEDRLRRSLEMLVERNAILRTVFQAEAGVPIQKVLKDVYLPFRCVDLSTEKNPMGELRIRITDLNQETFDISAAPPYRMVLFHIGKDLHVLAVIIHHIVIDGWSAELFKRELVEIYKELDNAVFTENPTPISYADYACWQRSKAFTERVEPQLAYWQKRLMMPEGETQLPLDKPRLISQTSHADTFWLKISGKELEDLCRYSREKNVTQFAVLLAAFCAALNRHVQQPVLNLGSFFANRPLPELENVMGPFVNGVVLRVDMSGDPSFDELVARVSSVVIEAQQNQEAPIEKVIERINPDRDKSRRTLFGVVFNFVNIPRLKQDEQALEVDYFDFEAGTATYDLNVEFNQSDEGLNFAFEFNTDIYLRATIECFAGHFNHLLQQALTEPDRPIGGFEILSFKEMEQLDSWSGGAGRSARDIPVHHLFEEQVRKTPEAIAVMSGGQSVTFENLNRRANKLARFLLKKGVKADELVGISLPRSIDMVAALLAVMKAGGAYLPLDPAYPAEHLKYILDDAKPILVLTDKNSADKLPLESRRLVCLQNQQDEVQKEAASNLDTVVEANGLVYCIYTSGSTGRPKGVLVEHHSLSNFTLGALQDYAISPADRMLQFASLNFDTSAEEIFPALCSGAVLVLRSQDMLDSITHFLQRCDEWGVTILDLPTAFWHELVLYMEKSIANLPEQLRLVIIGGERVSPAHVKTWHKLIGGSVRLDNTYGLTECTCVVSRCELTPYERSLYGHREVTIGKAVDNVKLYVLDRQMRRVPAGVSGELFVGGNCLARGYLNLPELTKERFIPDMFSGDDTSRLYRTGDVVQWRPDGTLEYLGRSDEQVKIRGFRIEPGEIESVLIKQPKVKDAIVVKRTDPAGTEQLAAYLLAEDGAEISIKDLKDAMVGRLPKYMLPACYQVLPEFPLSPSRKIDKNALPEPGWDGSADNGSRAIPATQAEEKMLAIWEEALGKKGIGVEDNFFDVGGHSLLAARMMTEVERVFGVPIPLVVLLEKPTIRELTSAIEDADWKPTWKSLVRMKASGDQEPIFLVHAIGGDILSYRRLVERLQGLDRPIYGIRAQGLGGVIEPFTDIKEMVAFYLKEMKEIQPHGPYYLGGYSFGGTVAYEMAQQLIASGEEVAWLAMFDTVVLQNMPSEMRPGRLAMMLNELRRFLFVCLKFLRISLPKKKEYIKKLFAVLVGRLSALIRGKEYISPVEQQDHDRWQRKPPAFQKIEMANNSALKAYIVKPYPGRITLFKAREREWSEMVDPKPLWRRLAREGLNTYVCDGNHRTILLEPYVGSLARELIRSIQAYTQRMKD